MAILTNNLGFPRIGENRELKKATEAFWKGTLAEEELRQCAADIRRKNWQRQKEKGIDLIPSNDFSLYDQMLDMCCVLGAVPERFGWSGGQVGCDTYFAMARGVQQEDPPRGVPALEMTKWFDTNYHYLVPEFHRDQEFCLSFNKTLDEFAEAMKLGIKTKPVLIGPLSFLILGKEKEAGFDRLSLLTRLLPVYTELLNHLAARGAEWMQIDEPCLALDLTEAHKEAYERAFQEINQSVSGVKIILTSYFGPLDNNLELKLKLPADAYHFDLVRGEIDLEAVLSSFPAAASLSLGVINGRNIWKNNYQRSMAIIQKARDKVGAERLMVAPSCSLIHVPITLANEPFLNPELKAVLAFAAEKLEEIATLAGLAEGSLDPSLIEQNQQIHQAWQIRPEITNPQVRARLKNITAEDLQRSHRFTERIRKQRKVLSLPLFPTTTTGSFPQTREIRAARRRFKQGELSRTVYEDFIQKEIQRVIEEQEELGLDVLVHGEFERNDMVEYFAELFQGFAFMTNGWVQSFGSRYVKPPIIYGDVQRPEPMTVRWICHAQSLTARPVKGMLTGPVTMARWSFVREDQPRSETTRQIALAIRDEVHDLEQAGIRIIQIDEPALREGLPFKRQAWNTYLQWAVEAFRLACCCVRDETQIHTHMCYSEFNDIIEAISAMDADVLAIEASRSQMELLEVFEEKTYPNQIGPGVYDVHSPRVPEVSEIVRLLEKACEVLPRENIWVNPDCGLKTRSDPESRASLRNLVDAARVMRDRYAGKS